MAFDTRTIPEDWIAVIVSLYKSEGDKSECKNNRRMNPLCVVGKVYGKILINCV